MLGFLVALRGGLVAGGKFPFFTPWYLTFDGAAAPDVAWNNAGWGLAFLSFLSVPVCFIAWRRTRASLLRYAGFALSIAVAVSVPLLVVARHGRWAALFREPYRDYSGAHWTLVGGAILFAAAFLVAPAPIPRDDD